METQPLGGFRKILCVALDKNGFFSLYPSEPGEPEISFAPGSIAIELDGFRDEQVWELTDA